MNYGDKRDYPKIETYFADGRGGTGFPLVTTWARTVKEARERRATAEGVPVHQVKGRKVN